MPHMQVAEQTDFSRVTPRSSLKVSRGLVLIIGVLAVPFALMLVFTSYTTVTVDSALRQAFAGVAGQTVAMLSAVTTVAMTAFSRRWRELPLFVVIAALVCTAAVNSMVGTAEQLWWLLRGLT
ncbi:hypothetical protein ASF76_03365 [Microbacterium sp. Leaf151]|nr:hypothetical protein ASF76_03365 [Microbacterium sp. Leaf151]